MNDKIERVLKGLAPRGAPADLRDRVLGSVLESLAGEPAVTRRVRWDLRVAAAVAASLILGATLNLWAIRSDDARQARLYGPDVLPRGICETVQTAEHVAGPECAEWVRQQVVSAWRSRQREDLPAFARYHEQLMRFVLTEKGTTDVEADSQVDGHRAGRPDRSALDCQRRLCVA
jgi:hypothetical protein